MSFVLQPWQLLFAILSGLVQRRQQQIIEFQNSEIEALLKQLGKKRILLTDDQRRLLAVKGHSLGRKILQELTVLSVTTFCTFSREFSPAQLALTPRFFGRLIRERPEP